MQQCIFGQMLKCGMLSAEQKHKIEKSHFGQKTKMTLMNTKTYFECTPPNNNRFKLHLQQRFYALSDVREIRLYAVPRVKTKHLQNA